MIYIERNAQGEICNLEFTPSANREEICLTSEELVNYIRNSDEREGLTRRVLDQLDLDMVRVIEDLIDIMIDRNLMRFTDLPGPVQNKLLFKRKIRNLNTETFTMQEEEVLDL